MMTLDDVKATLRVYSHDTTWNVRSDKTAYVPYEATEAQAQAIGDMLGQLWASRTAQQVLSELASSGEIRVGLTQSTELPGVYLASAQFPGSPASDPYVIFNPQPGIFFVDEVGRVTQQDPTLVLVHELVHWARDYRDPAGVVQHTVNNADLNSEGYDHLGTVTVFERQVASELNLPDRLDYFDAVASADANRLGVVTSEADWTGFHHIDVVRIGDATQADFPNDIIDYSGWTAQPAVLAFGMSGDDTIYGAAHNDYLYGNGGSDELSGLGGDDVLFGSTPSSLFDDDDGTNTLNGDDGKDKLFAGPHGDILYGGNGDDTIIGGAGDDQIHGDGNKDLIFTGGGQNTVWGGADDDRIVLTKPGEAGELSNLSVIMGGAGTTRSGCHPTASNMPTIRARPISSGTATRATS